MPTHRLGLKLSLLLCNLTDYSDPLDTNFAAEQYLLILTILTQVLISYLKVYFVHLKLTFDKNLPIMCYYNIIVIK